MRRLGMSLCALIFSLSSVAIAQTNRSILGTWRLVSATSIPLKGPVDPYTFGKNPSGFMTFTSDGRMSLMMADDGRKPLSVLDRVSAPSEERAQAFATFVAYAGTYTLSGDRLIYHVEVASIQNWVGTDLVRIIAFHDGALSTRTLTTVKGGVKQVIELMWKRVE